MRVSVDRALRAARSIRGHRVAHSTLRQDARHCSHDARGHERASGVIEENGGSGTPLPRERDARLQLRKEAAQVRAVRLEVESSCHG